MEIHCGNPRRKERLDNGANRQWIPPFERLTIRNKEIHSVPKTNRAGILPASFLRRYRMSRPLGDACSNSSVPDCLSYATMRNWNKPIAMNCRHVKSVFCHMELVPKSHRYPKGLTTYASFPLDSCFCK